MIIATAKINNDLPSDQGLDGRVNLYLEVYLYVMLSILEAQMNTTELVKLALLALVLPACSNAPISYKPDQGKLLATGGISQIEGVGGGGLTPWALISGYGSDTSYGGSLYYGKAKVTDFELESYGASVGIADRIEVSYAKQVFDTDTTGPALGLRGAYKFKQDIIGAKVKLVGNAVYGQDTWLPQIAVGAQYKKIDSDNRPVVSALGATDDKGVDIYVSATKILLDKNLIISGTLRGTKANQMGLLGFGGDQNNDYALQAEGSLAYMVSKKLVVGADYRMKPDNLSFAEETDAAAAYIAYFPNKNMSVALAAVDMGRIANQGRQTGVYLSTQVGF